MVFERGDREEEKKVFSPSFRKGQTEKISFFSPKKSFPQGFEGGKREKNIIFSEKNLIFLKSFSPQFGEKGQLWDKRGTKERMFVCGKAYTHLRFDFSSNTLDVGNPCRVL